MAPELEYLEGGAWYSIPYWAQYLWDLGEGLCASSSPDVRAVLAVTVPTRAFAAPLVSAGYLAARSALNVFTQQTFPVGTSVIYSAANGENLRAKIEGYGQVIAGAPRITLRVSTSAKRYIDYKLGTGLRRMSTEFVPKEKLQKVALPAPGNLCQHLLKGDCQTYAQEGKLDCLLFGRPGLLEPELHETSFRSPSHPEKSAGTLAELIMPQRATGPREAWHTRIVGPGAPLEDWTAREDAPPLVIFDGTSSFRKWRHRCHRSDWVVILDRSKADLEEGLDLVQEEYASRSDQVDMASLAVPDGVENMMFLGKRR